MIAGIKYRTGQVGLRAGYAMRGATNLARLRVMGAVTPAGVASVMVGRNDDYMPDFTDRLRAVIGWNARHFVDEVIFVEWNPPADHDLLGPLLTREFPSLKVYVVPTEIHQRVCRNPKLPLMEYHAKNVGIRRAQADWVIATNADVAIGASAIRAFAASRPDPNVIWTAQRVDIHWQEWRRRGIGLADCVRYKRIIPYDKHGTGDFLLASREMWHRIRGYDENLLKHRIGCDVRGAAQMLAHGAEIRRIGDILHLAHPTSCTEGVQAHHGEYAPMDNLPYENDPGWGLGDSREVQIAERVWRLE
jgi:hypothetical protein